MKSDAELKDFIDLNESRSEWAARVIVLALCVEAALIFSPEAAWRHWVEFLATALIALGVYGEIHFGRLSKNAMNELLLRSESRLLEAVKKAEDARSQADFALFQSL